MEKPSEVLVEFDKVIAQFEGLPEPDKFVEPYRYARDIAYGNIGSRNPYDVLLANKGTCSGKHALLKLIYESLGYEVKSFFAKHNFGNFPISSCPEELAEYQGQDIPDYHDFLKIKIGDEWVTLDAVFDSDIVRLGFPKLEWDGTSDMQLPVATSEVFEAKGDMEEHKKMLIAALPEEQQVLRKRFLSDMTEWLDKNR